MPSGDVPSKARLLVLNAAKASAVARNSPVFKRFKMAAQASSLSRGRPGGFLGARVCCKVCSDCKVFWLLIFKHLFKSRTV